MLAGIPRQELMKGTFAICVIVTTVFITLQYEKSKYGRVEDISNMTAKLMDTEHGNIQHNTTELGWKALSDTFSGQSLTNSKMKVVSNMITSTTDETKIVNRYNYNAQTNTSGNNATQLRVQNKQTREQYNTGTSYIKIGILIPACTRSIRNPVFEKLSLMTICLPALYKTIEKKYAYTIYIGIDKGDYLEKVQHKLKAMFQNVTIVINPGPVKTLTKAANLLASQAYKDGMDYFHRLNDDTSLETQNWTSLGIDVLRKYEPSNVGVVGPTCKQGNIKILTHDMTHRKHLEIFGYYYPPYFANYYNDDWISAVYQPGRYTVLSTWTVIHHIYAHGTRYEPDIKKKAQLKKILLCDKRRLLQYLKNFPN